MYGEISAKAGARHGVGVKGTRANPRFHAQEEEFHGRQGRADQGKGKQRGRPEATTRHINTRQTMGSPGRAGGAPSRGGSAGPQQQPTQVDHINAGSLTQPQFYTGSSPAVTKGQVRSGPPGGGKPSPGSASAGRPPKRGAPPMQKPGQQTGWYGAAGRRP